ncbi:uncharacterized protein LOC132742291 [Ruditapes philippinarum]|uniref:uncharacterized protein LOC132742291 n=1 Tax=Ruditapes philippinarum TaxID=129788 RepID=UPI00295AC4F8|nr:uncharacterized protein LOC132742291 [Ruditapes philippinarum]
MRRGNFKIMKMALDKLTNLFHGLNMTIYMDQWFKFENILLKAPPEIKSFIEENICLSQSGHPSKAEGGDFILESTNKRIKSYMPYGVPTDERWTRVCLNIDNIEKMKKAVTRSTCIDTDNDEAPNRYFRYLSVLITNLLQYIPQFC